MKERNKLIIAIVAVLLIIIAVGGATYAYWSWSSTTAQKTNVTFTVNQSTLEGQMYAKLDGGGATTINNLAPVSSCLNSTYAVKVPVTLKYKNATTNPAFIMADLTISSFSAPHGTPDSDDLKHLHYALTTSSSSCTSDLIKSGTFSATSGTLISDNGLGTGTIAANTTTEQSKTMYLYIWIDSAYTHTNTGSAITDPLQDISFTLTWSGTISNEPLEQ